MTHQTRQHELEEIVREQIRCDIFRHDPVTFRIRMAVNSRIYISLYGLVHEPLTHVFYRNLGHRFSDILEQSTTERFN